jgi:hypothetical protein
LWELRQAKAADSLIAEFTGRKIRCGVATAGTMARYPP